MAYIFTRPSTIGGDTTPIISEGDSLEKEVVDSHAEFPAIGNFRPRLVVQGQCLAAGWKTSPVLEVDDFWKFT